MIEINNRYEVEFIDMTHDAMGVCKIDGFPVFVKHALKGEKATIKVNEISKKYGFGEIIQLQQSSPYRKDPICEHFYECGGCDLMHMSYDMQSLFKHYRTAITLKRLGKIDLEPEKMVGMTNPYYYRNKVVMPIGQDLTGKTTYGFYKKGTHIIEPMRKCLIIPKYTHDIIKFIVSFMNDHGIKAYSSNTKEGTIKHVVIRSSNKEDDISIVLISKIKPLPQLKTLADSITSKFDKVKTIVMNYHLEDTKSTYGEEFELVYGDGYIVDRSLDIGLRIHHQSFYQINPIQTDLLYKKALDLAELNKSLTAVDAYCGIGSLTLNIAKHVKNVYGIEVVKQAIEDAIDNAEENKIDNATFLLGKSENLLKTIEEPIDVIFIDPPRKGVDHKLLDTIIEKNIKKVIYISCNVATLARDLNILQAAGYDVLETTPFDMFPQTAHIESVTLLELK
jgi:23S rRNA (uracil1939-C5)-methyltransferase